MKFLCVDCDEQMHLEERREPGDGTFAASFRCPRCDRSVVMLANPAETRLVGALGVKIGGRELDAAPMELVRGNIVGRTDAFTEAERRSGRPVWTADAEGRLARVPNFVHGMVKKIYTEYAVEHDITEITPEVMDQARSELGLEGM